MKYVRISLLTVLVLATTGCDDFSDNIAYFFSTGGSLRHGTSVSVGETSGEAIETSDGAILVISSLP